MSDEVPTLWLSAQELFQWSQGAAAVLVRLRAGLGGVRAVSGRLAFSDAEHAARLSQSWQWPPVRLMTDAEQVEWRSRVPAALAGTTTGGEPVVCVARLDAVDHAMAEWGVEAHVRAPDGSTESVFLVCRDASDAVALAAGMRRDGSAEQVRRLRAFATAAAGTDAREGDLERPRVPLGEREWVAALREELPPRVADRLIPSGPEDRRAPAWRELLRLARGEVARVDADPHRLAALIRSVPYWDDRVRDPAALAHWALVQARAEPGYTAAVTGGGSGTPHGAAAAGVGPRARPASPASSAAASHAALRPRPSGPTHAITWAAALDSRNAEHRLAAKVEFGRWGAAVDRALAERFPGLVTSASTAAHRAADHSAPSAQPPRRSPAQRLLAGSADGGEDVLTHTELAEQVQRMDPARPVDRRAAHVMLGRVPSGIDRLLAAKFGDDPAFAAKLATVYPHGLPADPAPPAPPAGPAATPSPPTATAPGRHSETRPPHVAPRPWPHPIEQPLPRRHR